MTPKVIYLIRHGEKPGDAQVESADDGIHLSAVGHSRAEALGQQKDRIFGLTGEQGVDYLFAASRSEHSMRCLETATPLSRALKLKLHRKWACEEYDKAAKALLGKRKYHGKTLIVCWHHGELPNLIHALGGSVEVKPMNGGKWDGLTFDRVIKLTFNGDGTVQTESLPQCLLYKDAKA